MSFNDTGIFNSTFLNIQQFKQTSLNQVY